MADPSVSSSAPRVRIAPSPTGFFHVGGARTALYNWAIAKQQGGRFVLRIEDTDLERHDEAAVEGIISALAWLGIDHNDQTFEGPYRQSDYADAHIAAAHQLYESGHAYYCDLTPEQIQERAAANGKPGYDGYSRDRGLGGGPGRVLRFKVPAGGSTVVADRIRGDVVFEHANIEDFVLLRSNGTPLFLLANVVDDAEMKITLVVRGEEHLANTPKQQLIWEALGHTPPTWAHVPVLVNEQRKKLSKRRDKVALEQYRDEGYLADAMVNYLMTLGWAPGDQEIVPWSEIETAFDLADVTQSPAFFDLKKLAAFNGDYIRMLSVDEFVAACEPWIPAEYDREIFAAMAPHLQTRIVTLAEAPAMVDFLMRDEPVHDEPSWIKAMHQRYSRPVLAEAFEAYEHVAWEADALKTALEEIGARHDIKLGKAQAPIRVAVTGRTVGPPLFEALEVLGRDGTLARIAAAVARLPRD